MPCAVHPEILTGLTTCSRCSKDFCGDCIISLQGRQVCGACKPELVRDIRSGVKDGLDLAHPGRRFIAHCIDTIVIWLIIAVVGGLVTAAFIMVGSPGLGLLAMVVICIIMLVGYEALALSRSARTGRPGARWRRASRW